MVKPTETQADPKPTGHLRRLKVQALMILVLAFSLAMGWVVHQARVQRDAVAAIERAGGIVSYDWHMKNRGSLDLQGLPRISRWLIERLGVDFFSNVVAIHLRKDATDAAMVHVGWLSHLEQISLERGSRVTDAGVAHLRGLADLKAIHLSNSRVTGACLANFRSLSRLEDLDLGAIILSDADLAHLADLTHLRYLDLSSTKVTDAGLVHLERLVNLLSLDLSSTGVTGPGLAHLQGMTRLNRLNLASCKIADLSSIPSLPGLQFLTLSDTSVDDAQLEFLPKLPALVSLFLNNTRVTDAGLLRLGGLEENPTTPLPVESKRTAALLARPAILEKLQQINFIGTAVTDAGIVRLQGARPGLSIMPYVPAATRSRTAGALRPNSQGTPTP